jgi:hypothetical protein
VLEFAPSPFAGADDWVEFYLGVWWLDISFGKVPGSAGTPDSWALTSEDGSGGIIDQQFAVAADIDITSPFTVTASQESVDGDVTVVLTQGAMTSTLSVASPGPGRFGKKLNRWEFIGRAPEGQGTVFYVYDLDIPGVNRCTTVWTDRFNRTVAAGSGLGSRYTWTDWDSGWGSQAESLTHVDGAVGRMPGGVDGSNYDSYYLNMPAIPLAGTAQVDFYVPATWDSGNPQIGLAFPLPGDFYGDVYARAGAAGLDWSLQGLGTTAPAPTSFTTDAASWYTIKMGWDADGNVDQKVWKVGSVEPDWIQSYSAPTTDQRDLTGPLLDLYYGVVGGDLMFDNLIIVRS